MSFANAKWSNRHFELRRHVHFGGYDTKVLEKNHIELSVTGQTILKAVKRIYIKFYKLIQLKQLSASCFNLVFVYFSNVAPIM